MTEKRFLLVGDLHGEEPYIGFEDFDAVLSVGDFCTTELRETFFKVIRETRKNPESKLEWFDVHGKTETKRMIKKSIDEGHKSAKSLNKLRVPVFVVPGNWDWAGVEWDGWEYSSKNRFPEVISGLENFHPLHLSKASFKGIGITGYGISNSPEMPITKEGRTRVGKERYQSMKNDVEKNSRLLAELMRSKQNIFITHNPPYGTKVDKIQDKKSPKYLEHNGSLVARKAILKARPDFVLSGHIHESEGRTRLKGIPVVNLGEGNKNSYLLKINKSSLKLIKK